MSDRPNDAPWSIKGVSPEVRRLAKRAASEAGIPIGTWLTAAIREIGEAEMNDPDTGRDAPDPAG